MFPPDLERVALQLMMAGGAAIMVVMAIRMVVPSIRHEMLLMMMGL